MAIKSLIDAILLARLKKDECSWAETEAPAVDDETVSLAQGNGFETETSLDLPHPEWGHLHDASCCVFGLR